MSRKNCDRVFLWPFASSVLKDLDGRKTLPESGKELVSTIVANKGTARDGDLVSPVNVNECWDAAFVSRYFAKSDEPAVGYGVEATDCAYATAAYSPL